MALVRGVSASNDTVETNGILLISAGAFVIYLLAVLGVEMTRAAGNVASIWLPNIVALALLYRLPRMWWPVGLAVAFGGILAANLSFGDPLDVSLGLSAANLMEIALGFLALRLIGFHRADILTTGGFIKFLIVAGVAAPAVGASVGAGVVNHFYGAPFLAVAQTWWLSGVVGVVILGPAVMAPTSTEIVQRPLAISEIAGWAAASTALVWLTNVTGAELMVYLCPLLVVFAGIRVGLTASGFAGSIFAVYLALSIVESPDMSQALFAGNLLEMQVFLLASMGMAHSVAMLWHQRMDSEQELARYVDALQDTDEAIVFVDADFKPVSWNSSLEKLLPEIDSVPSGGRAAYREQNLALFGQLRAGKTVEDQEVSRAVSDGSILHFLLSARPTYRAGLMDGAILRYRDVTTERRLMKSVEERVGELEAFLDSSDDAVIGTDANGQINIINQVACDFHGISREEAIGKPIFELEGDESAHLARFQDVADGNEIRHLRMTRTAADGRVREVERSITAVRDADGAFAGIAGVQRDVTDLLEMGAQVEFREVLLDKVFSALSDGIAIFDKDELLVRCNEEFSQAFGQATVSEVIGMTWTEFTATNLREGRINGGELSDEEWLDERRRLRNEGMPGVIELADGRWMLGTDYLNEDGGFVAIRQDITDLVNAQNELSRSNQELEQFAFVASHDLQEPLRKICAFGSIIEDEYLDKFDKDGQQYLRSMINGAIRMQTLINELLNYSRVARDPSSHQVHNLTDLARAAEDNLSILLKETDATLEIGDLGSASVNQSDMTRVFQNLITNSIRYADTDRPPRITIASRSEGEKLFIDVQDNGIGMDAKYTEMIFEPFKRLHGQSQIPGSGMGLAIVRKIMRSVSGNVTVQSTIGEGTTFTLSLPRVK